MRGPSGFISVAVSVHVSGNARLYLFESLDMFPLACLLSIQHASGRYPHGLNSYHYGSIFHSIVRVLTSQHSADVAQSWAVIG